MDLNLYLERGVRNLNILEREFSYVHIFKAMWTIICRLKIIF